MDEYIDISKAFGSSLVEKAGASTALNSFVPINKVAKAKGLKGTRAIRLKIQSGQYIAREVTVRGGKSYEILIESLEYDIQALVKETPEPFYYPAIPTKSFVPDTAKTIALARIDIIKQWASFRIKYQPKCQGDKLFLEMYNSGEFLKRIYSILGKTSKGTLKRWKLTYDEFGNWEALVPQYKYSSINNHKTILTDEMINIFLKFLLHPNKFSIGKAINLTIQFLKNKSIQNIPSIITFRRYAENFRKHNFDRWTLLREGEKAYHDKVEAYIERDISKLEVGDVLIADGHVLNFQVINPFTGKPTRATLVGFLDWKSTALVGYEIMMTENTQCIASALRNAIINLGFIPKIVYQDNGRAFRAKYFQNCNFEEAGFNGVYENLGIKSVFAKPYNARAKVIERFFLEFQEEFEKLMPTYTGTSIENKPAWMKRGEKFHRELHLKTTGGKIPTVQDAIKLINCWLEYHNSKPCPNDKSRTIQEVLRNDNSHCLQTNEKSINGSKVVRPFSTAHTSPRKEGNQSLNSVQKENINTSALDDLMMKTETRTINKHGITFLGMHYRSEAILGLREMVNIRYSLFDLSKLHVYSTKGEFICVAKRENKVHPMAYHLGTVKDIEDFKQKIQKQKRTKNKIIKEVKKYLPSTDIKFLEQQIEDEIIEAEPTNVIELKSRKQTPREEQINKKIFASDYEKYEWLMQYGCTNTEDRHWLANYIRSDEYNNLYADCEQRLEGETTLSPVTPFNASNQEGD